MRQIGFALLGVAVVVDAVGPVIMGWRRAVAALGMDWVEQAAPTENFLIDAVIELLHASEIGARPGQ